MTRDMGYIELEGSIKAIKMCWAALDANPEQSALELLNEAADFLPLV